MDLISRVKYLLRDAYMIGSVCRLFSGKPLSKPMLVCSLNHWENNQFNSNQNATIFSQENKFENVVCKMAAILSRP